MKKQLTMLLAAALCASSITLGACGGASTSADGAQTNTEASSAQEEAKDPSQAYVGTWKLAYIQMDGITITGDFSGMVDVDQNFALELKADGTGTATTGDETEKLTWKLTDNDAIEISNENSDEPMRGTYDQKQSAMLVELNSDGRTGNMVFTADGTAEGILDIDAEKAANVTSLDELKGDWKLAGAGMMGMVMYGDADALSEMIGSGYDANLSIADDGSVTMSSQSGTKVTVDSSGATIGNNGMNMKLKKSGDYLVLDMTDILGMSLFLLYAK